MIVIELNTQRDLSQQALSTLNTVEELLFYNGNSDSLTELKTQIFFGMMIQCHKSLLAGTQLFIFTFANFLILFSKG